MKTEPDEELWGNSVNKKPIVVNLYGAPGSGKSTGAAYIFSQLKLRNVNCELITEYAKEKVWEGAEDVLKHQLYVFAKQLFRMERCKDKVDVLITDSPLLLSAYYDRLHEEPVVGDFNKLVLDTYNTFHNLNYFIVRCKPYQQTGRVQTEAEAEEVGRQLQEFLRETIGDYMVVEGALSGYEWIVEDVLSKGLVQGGG